MRIVGLMCFIFSFLLLSNVSAGLIISNINTTLNVNKVYGIDYPVNITILNQETFNFNNISFETPSIISAPLISSLGAGQQASFIAYVKTNENLNTQLRIKGYYSANVGQANRTYDVLVNPYFSTPCTFSVVKGEYVKFTSNIVSTINLKEFPSGVPVDGSTLTTNQSFTKSFNEIGTKGYQWFIGSWGFSEVCYITTLNDTGLINNPAYDGILNLSVTTQYSPTNISYTLFQNNYSLDFFESTDGILSITNIGNSTAKNITLTNEWMTFNYNNFDLSPSISKAISYTVKPKVYTTNETNKTYTKNLEIRGNFNTITIPFNIFVKYAEINSNLSQNTTNFLDWVCSNFPDLCNPKIEYRYITNDSNINRLPVTDDQWRDMNLQQQEDRENEKISEARILESNAKTIEFVNATKEEVLEQVRKTNDKIDKDTEDRKNFKMAIIIILLAFAIAIALIVLFYFKRIKLQEAFKRF